jgi:hypothetical protein
MIFSVPDPSEVTANNAKRVLYWQLNTSVREESPNAIVTFNRCTL